MTDTLPASQPSAGWHLWAVGIVGILWNGFGCFDFTMTATRNMAYLSSFPQEMLDYWFAMPWWMWAIWAIGVFGGLLGSVLLLMRRAGAIWLFAASFLAAVFSMAIGATAEDAPSMEGSWVFSILILGIAFLLLAYASWQKRRGVLR